MEFNYSNMTMDNVEVDVDADADVVFNNYVELLHMSDNLINSIYIYLKNNYFPFSIQEIFMQFFNVAAWNVNDVKPKQIIQTNRIHNELFANHQKLLRASKKSQDASQFL